MNRDSVTAWLAGWQGPIQIDGVAGYTKEERERVTVVP
jgi:hypothetical protein